MAVKITSKNYNGSNLPTQISAPANTFEVGIQSIPGLIFQINNSNPIVLGRTGIFSLNVENYDTISTIAFPSNDNAIITNNNNFYLKIDLLSGEKEG